MMNKKTKSGMDVVILCGGIGTRMKEETETRPKPMVEIGQRPILWHIMKYYAHYGFNRFILALGYKGEHIRKYFESPLFRRTGWDVSCIDTGPRTLKGGRIKRIEPYLESGTFHLTYGDGLGTVDLHGLVSFHKRHERIGTVTAVHPPSRFGEMMIKGSRVVEFEEKPQLTSGCINGGFFMFERSFLKYLTSDEDCDLEFGALQKLSRQGQLMAYRHDGYWQCMDTVRDMEYLNKLWKSGSPPWKVWKR